MKRFVLIDGPTDTIVAELTGLDSAEQAAKLHDDGVNHLYTRTNNPPHPPQPGYEVFMANAQTPEREIDLANPKDVDYVREHWDYHCTLIRMPANHHTTHATSPLDEQ